MKKAKLAVAGLAISISLLSVTAVATAKASLGQFYPTATHQQMFSFNAQEDLFIKDTKFRVNWASDSEVTKPGVQNVSRKILNSQPIKKERPKVTNISVKTSMKSEHHQTKVKSAKKTLRKLAHAETVSPRHTVSNKIHTLEVGSGNNIEYSRLIPVKATAYTAAAEENGLWGAYDYYGNPLKLGTIAVDPDVIPMGSTVFITGYTFDGLPAKGMIAKATDMGSAVQGKRVDIFVPTSRADASKFGMQDVKVYILK